MIVTTLAETFRVLGVRFRKDGKIAYYSLDDDHIASLVGEGFRYVGEQVR